MNFQKHNLNNFFKPSLFVQTLAEINLVNLKQNGIKYVFCDLDNTLVPHFISVPNDKNISFINEIHELGMKIIVISNNKKKRVTNFCQTLKIDDLIWNARKPFLKKTKKIIEKHKIHIEEIVFIGDQIITDVFTSNRLNILSILVLPIVGYNRNKNNKIINFIDLYIYSKMDIKIINNDLDWLGENSDFI